MMLLFCSLALSFCFSNSTYADDSITVTISGNPTITVAPTSEGTFADSGGSYGGYWSATSGSNSNDARPLYFNSTYVYLANSISRYNGSSVRCVFSGQ